MRTLALVRKEFLQFWRDPALVAVVLWCFSLDIYLVARGFSMEIKNYPVAILNRDDSQLSENLISYLRAPEFRIVAHITTDQEFDRMLSTGEALLVLEIPKNFSRKLARGQPADVLVALDGTNSNTASMALAHIQTIFSQAKIKFLDQPHSRSIPDQIISLRPRLWFNPNLDGTWFTAFSELCSEITMVAILLPAAALVREKEYGTIEQLLVSPLKPWQIMLSKIIPMIILVLVVTTLCLYAILGPVFDFYPIGSLTTFLVATAIYVGACAGLGMLLATAAKNLSQVLLMLVTAMVPIMFLSGTWSPPEAMPPIIRWFTKISPLSYYLEIGYGVFFKGWDFSQSLVYMIKLLIFSGGLFILGTSRMSRQLG
ncbi:MAG: ABC transporter permease [Phycisphaerae bacterium]